VTPNSVSSAVRASDDDKLQRAGSRGLRFCNRKHAAAYRKQQGGFTRLASLGNAAQAEYKKIHGKAPGCAWRSKIAHEAAILNIVGRKPRKKDKMYFYPRSISKEAVESLAQAGLQFEGSETVYPR